MQTRNVPETGPRYWAALSLASVFGANMGDFVSRILHLGHANGLPLLALVFGLILGAERRSKPGNEAYYWLAIVTLRTAATNLADLATHDLGLGYPWVMAGLAALLIGVLVVEGRSPARAKRDAESAELRGMPATNDFYWAAMLIAGTLGTAIGDFVADDLGLGLAEGSILLCALLALMFYLRGYTTRVTKSSYWRTIVVVRAAGTTVGDFFASRHGLGLGLPVSTPCTGLLLVLMLLLWPRQGGKRTVEA